MVVVGLIWSVVTVARLILGGRFVVVVGFVRVAKRREMKRVTAER